MSRTAIRTALASIAAGLALVPGTAIGQAEPSAQSIDITGAYAYVDKPMRPNATRSVMVVFKMAERLSDRATSVDGGGQQSIAYPGARCFYMTAGTKGRKLGPDGRTATYGSKHRLRVWTYPNGDLTQPRISDAITFKVRRHGSRADARKRLGC